MSLKITNSKILLFIAAFLYVSTFHASYYFYINPVFEYAHYRYIEKSFVMFVFVYLMAILPLLFFRNGNAPSVFGVSIIYVFCYAPAQLTMFLMWDSDLNKLIFLCIGLYISMSLIFVISALGCKNSRLINKLIINDSRLITNKFTTVINIFTYISLFLLIYENHGHMSLVSFDDVYFLREASAMSGGNTLSKYFIMWLSFCFIPFYAITGLVSKNWLTIVFSILLGLIVYMANGSKSALFQPFLVILFWYFFDFTKKNTLSKLLASLSLVISILLCISSNISDSLKSVLLVRTLSTGGWTLVTYYEYFTKNGYTYFTHLWPIELLFAGYPYGEYSLGQLIGIEYSGSSEANFNANFWASDGIASMGIWGLMPATLLLLIILYLIDNMSKYYQARSISLWMLGFWMALTNAPVTTAFFSGGGFLIIVFLYLSSFYDVKKHPFRS